MSWMDELEHEKLTPEAKEILSKFPTAEDAHIGYVELQKTAGKPFKLPKDLKSVDTWPDENDKKVFREGLNGLFKESHIRPEGIKSEDDLKDIDFAKGYADARNYKEDFGDALKKHAVKKGWPKYIVEEMLELVNPYNQSLINTRKREIEENLEKVKESLKVLYGDEKTVESNYENVRRFFQNHCGLSEQEYQSAGESFVNDVLMKNAVMSKALMNHAKDIVKEGSTEHTKTGGEKEKESMSQRQDRELPIITGALGWRK